MDNEMIGGKLKMIYKDVKAPDGFSLRVMRNIKAEAVQLQPLNTPSRLLRQLRPALAVAACFILILGLYLADMILPGVPSIDEREAVQAPLKGDASSNLIIAESEPYLNGDDPVVKPEAEEKPEVIPTPVIPGTPVADASLAQNGQADDLPDTTVAQETPASPIAVRLVTASQDNGGAVLKPSLLPQPKPPALTVSPLETAPLAEKVTAFVLNEEDIPDASLFMPRRRVIDSVSVNITVGTINSGLLKLGQRERLFGISADVEATELRSDGTIVAMRSYLVPDSQVNSFVTQLSALGSDAQVKRDSIDITQDYQRMLDLHRKLIIDMTATGNGMRELNELVGELMFFDKRSRDGVQNVVVWLLDGVDF